MLNDEIIPHWVIPWPVKPDPYMDEFPEFRTRRRHKVPKEKKCQRFKLTISYDGTNYAGWQFQDDTLPTLQGTCEKVLSKLFEQPVRVNGSGRTDSGVHARGQVASFEVETRMEPGAILRACNAMLPQDIRVLKAERAGEKFHAQFDAKRKEYRYFIWNDAIMPPEKRLYHTHAPKPFDLAAMQKAAKHFVGEHDFCAFTANPQRDVKNTVRKIFLCEVKKTGKLFTVRVQGSGFLYKMVRSISGFLMRVGEGNESPDAALALLGEAAKRTARVPSASPRGLFLWRVWYK